MNDQSADTQRRPGSARGQVETSPDFDAPEGMPDVESTTVQAGHMEQVYQSVAAELHESVRVLNRLRDRAALIGLTVTLTDEYVATEEDGKERRTLQAAIYRNYE